MTTHQILPIKHNRSIKIRFAYQFLRALKKLNHLKETSSCRRYQMVKFASYASMASAVGSRKAWSRAMLRKIRNRSLIIPSLLKPHKIGPSKETENPRRRSQNLGEADQELRKLVPGGEGMDLYNLLDETAHYIKCLTSQVQIMRNILDLYSA